MNASLALPHAQRSPLWYAPLLLPVLPALALALHRQLQPGPAAWIALALLATLGGFLALGMPALLARASRLVRKEVEQMRTTWLIAVFVVQLPTLLPLSDGSEVSAMFFLGTCLLLSVLPFGLEFQHRTLHALLSQPVGRSELWRTKAGVAGAALALHALLALLLAAANYWVPQTLHPGFTRLASPAPNPSTLAFALGVFAIATFAAWGSGMLWSIVGRGVLPGLVFAVAVPVVSGITGGLIVDQFRSADSASSPISDWVWKSVVFGLLPAYGALCAGLAAMRWSRLEATDAGDEGSASLWVRRSSDAATASTRKIRTASGSLWRRELHLQTVTLVLLGLTALLALMVPLMSQSTLSGASFSYRDMAFGALVLLTCSTLLLAGATPIAEERRLGTLDAQLLLPISAAHQWRTKITLAALISVVALGFLGLAAASMESSLATPWTLLGALLVGSFGFSLAVLGSATSPNVLRALLTGLFGAVATFVLYGAIIASTLEWTNRSWHIQLDQPAPSLDWAWRAAESIDPAEARHWGGPQNPMSSFYRAGLWALGAYALLAAVIWIATLLARARRHFSQPALAPRQSVLLLLRVLVVFTLLTALGAATAALAMDWAQRKTTVAQAWHLRDWRTKLPSSDRLLLDRYSGGWLQSTRLLFPPEAARDPAARKLQIQFGWYVHGTNGVGVRHFTPPLKPEERQFIVQHAWIDETTRAALAAQIDLDPRETLSTP